MADPRAPWMYAWLGCLFLASLLIVTPSRVVLDLARAPISKGVTHRGLLVKVNMRAVQRPSPRTCNSQLPLVPSPLLRRDDPSTERMGSRKMLGLKAVGAALSVLSPAGWLLLLLLLHRRRGRPGAPPPTPSIFLTTTAKPSKQSWRASLNGAYWAVCYHAYQAVWDRDYAYPSLDEVLTTARVDGLKMLLEYLEEEGTEYTYWPEGIWEAKSPEGITTIARKRVLDIIPELRAPPVGEFAPGCSEADLVAAAARVRNHPALCYAVAFMGLTFAEYLIRNLHVRSLTARSDARRLVADAVTRLAKDAGYQDLFPIDVMRAWVRIKYRYDFNDLYPEWRGDPDVDFRDDVEDPGLVPGIDDDPSEFPAVTAEKAALEAKFSDLKRQGFVQQESATKGDFERWVADRRRQWEQSDDPVDNYPLQDPDPNNPETLPPPPSTRPPPESDPDAPKGFDMDALKNMRSEALNNVRDEQQDELDKLLRPSQATAKAKAEAKGGRVRRSGKGVASRRNRTPPPP